MLGRLPLSLALAGALCASARAQEPGVEYRWTVTVDPGRATVDVEGVVRLRNDGVAPLERLPLVLYPNRFLRVDPAISDITFDRYYVPFFDEGRLDLRWARALDGTPLRVELAQDEVPPAWEALAVEVVLPAPVAPGAWAEVRLRAHVDVPRRFGPFGHRGRRLTLEGGWHPWVPAAVNGGQPDPRGPPARARHEVALRVLPPDDPDDAQGALLDGLPLPPDGALVTTTTTPSLVVGPDLAPLARMGAMGAAPPIEVWGDPGDEARADRILRVAEQASAFFRDHVPDDAPLTPLVFVVAPLRDRFVQPTAGPVILWSDRLFHVTKPLQGFHDLEVARATIEMLTALLLRDAPLQADRDWVVEALGWAIARRWVEQSRAGVTGQTIAAGMRFLDFIPAIDSLLRAPRFVGSDVYYGRFFEPADAVPDELSRALSRRTRGRVALEKLRDRLGDERLRDLVCACLGRPPLEPAPGLEPGGLAASPFRARAAALAGTDLGPFFDLWLGPAPFENLAIEDVETLEALPDGGERVRVHIRRDGDPRVGEVGEPVVVETEGPDGEPVRVVWEGLGMQGAVVTDRHGLLFQPVELDPHGRVLQAYRGDDRVPAIAKLLLNRFRVRLDLNQANRNEAAIGFTLHPRYDYAHAVLVDGFFEEDERGVTLGYAYGFGTVIDERTYGTVVSTRLTVEQLAEGVLRDETIDESEGTLASVGVGLSFDTRLFRSNPTWGFGAGVGYERSDKTFGTDFRFDLFTFSIEGVYSIVRGTQLGVEVVAGQIVGTDVPTQRLFDAGGEGTVRGVEASEFVDRALIAIRGEWRQMLIEDLDVPLAWLAWLRKLQTVVFIDAGDVGETIEAVYEDRGDCKWGTGAGLRAWLDVFGVTPIVLRFDVGFRIDETDELGPQYYFGAGQSF